MSFESLGKKIQIIHDYDRVNNNAQAQRMLGSTASPSMMRQGGPTPPTPAPGSSGYFNVTNKLGG